MIQGRKIFNELLNTLANEAKLDSEVVKEFDLKGIDFSDIPFDEHSDNELIETIRLIVTDYQNKKGKLKNRDINKIFANK